ncbi:MAG: anti-sigma factor antagonist [Candidatus Omnitrophica bacterium]|jgi:stage II sporulation protein AA (anti-sigma F factor antagonist)|nr:anti-sigma factor antagonist [Candidatus Omnitrophota bacterium]
MEIRARQDNGIVILDLSGRIDVNAANLVEVIGQCLRDGYIDILCNLEEVDFIDYMGTSVVVIAYKEVMNNRGRMKFCNVPQHIRNILGIAGMDRVIEMYPDETLALNSFKEDKVIEDIQKMQLRRRFKRLPIDIKVELKAKYARNPVCLKLDLLNISAIGAFIFGCNKFALGDEVVLKMKLPPKREALELEAKIVWIPDKQVQPHSYPGVGVEFINMPPDIQQKLIDFIERNLSFMSTD